MDDLNSAVRDKKQENGSYTWLAGITVTSLIAGILFKDNIEEAISNFRAQLSGNPNPAVVESTAIEVPPLIVSSDLCTIPNTTFTQLFIGLRNGGNTIIDIGDIDISNLDSSLESYRGEDWSGLLGDIFANNGVDINQITSLNLRFDLPGTLTIIEDIEISYPDVDGFFIPSGTHNITGYCALSINKPGENQLINQLQQSLMVRFNDEHIEVNLDTTSGVVMYDGNLLIKNTEENSNIPGIMISLNDDPTMFTQIVGIFNSATTAPEQ